MIDWPKREVRLMPEENVLRVENPFTPSFGEIPAFMAGRREIIDGLDKAFSREGRSPDLTTLISGACGTGKTALLALAAERASERGWIAVNVPALPGMLDEILDQTYQRAEQFLERDSKRRMTGVGIGQVLSMEWEHVEGRPATWRAQIERIIDQLGSQGVGLLITVDEVRADLDEMIRLAATYQQFVRERKRVALLMAGFPYHISLLLKDQSASFLRRAQQRHLGRVTDAEIASALQKTVESSLRSIEDEALRIAVEGIEGFPFMMQLVGYQMWEAHAAEDVISASDAELGVQLARREMRSYVLEATYRELSDGDLAFLSAMLDDGDEVSVRDIAARMGKSNSYVSIYRKRLLEQGVIGERRRGVVGFELPVFREFLCEKLR